MTPTQVVNSPEVAREKARKQDADKISQAIVDKQESEWKAQHGDGYLSGIGLGMKFAGSAVAKGLSNVVPAVVYASDRVNKALTGQPLLSDDEKNELLDKTTESANLGLNPDYRGSNAAMTAVGGLLEFVPAALASESTAGASFFANGMGNAYKEVQEAKKSGAKFENGAEDLYIVARATSDMYLMTQLNSHSLYPTLPSSLRNMASKEVSIDAFKTLTKAGEPLTAENLLNAVKQSSIKVSDQIKNKGITFIKELAKGYTKTSADLSALTVADVLAKKGANALSGEEAFKVQDGSVGENIAHMLITDAPLFTLAGATHNVGLMFDKSPYKNQVVEKIKADPSPEAINVIKQQALQHAQERGWSEQDTQGTIEGIDRVANAASKIPNTFSDAKYNNALDIVLGKQNLEEQLAKVKEGNKALDPALAEIGTPEERALTAKLEQSDDKLREISTGKKVKYTQDPESGEYYKQLGGDGKPEKISKERYELEQVEQEARNVSESGKTKEELQQYIDHSNEVESQHRKLAEQETDPAEKAELEDIANKAKSVGDNAKTELNNMSEKPVYTIKGSEVTPKVNPEESVSAENAQTESTDIKPTESKNIEDENKQPLPAKENVASENISEKGNEEVEYTKDNGEKIKFKLKEIELQPSERTDQSPEDGAGYFDIKVGDNVIGEAGLSKMGDDIKSSLVEIHDYSHSNENHGKGIGTTAYKLLAKYVKDTFGKDLRSEVSEFRNEKADRAWESLEKQGLATKEVDESGDTFYRFKNSDAVKTGSTVKVEVKSEAIDSPQGISKEETRKQREYRGEEDLQPRDQKTLEGMFESGKKAVDDGIIDPRALAAEVFKKARNLSKDEVNALLYDRQRIKNGIESLYDQIDQAIQEGNKDQMEPLLQKQLYLEEQRGMNEEAVRTGANENALAQVSMRNMIKKDYSRSDQEARMRAKNGGVLTDDMRSEIKRYSDMLEEANRKLKEYEDGAINNSAKKELLRLQRENRKSNKNLDKDSLKTERKIIVDDFLAKLKEASSRLNDVTGVALDAIRIASPFIKKMVVNLTKEGIVELKDVINRVHEEFKDHIEGLTDGDVKDVLAGKYDENSTVKSLKNRLGRIKDRIANNDFSKPVPRPKVELTDEIITLRAKVKKAQNNFDAMAERLDKKNQSTFDKIADGYSAINRMFLLSGIKTLGKLYSFAAQRAISTPIEELFNTLNSKLPGLRKIADRSPRFAQGINIRAEAKAIAQKASSASWKDTWQVLKDGSSELDVLYGKAGVDKDFQLNRSAVEFFGRLHGAFKNSTKRAEFYRSYEKRLEYAAGQGKDINDPNVQFATALEAYADAKRAILMHDNKMTDGYKNMLRAMESRTNGEKGYTGKAMATFFRTILPIVKIPTNYVLEASDFATFGLRALPKIILAAAKGSEALSPKQATMVMRTLARGQFGLGMMMIAYYNPQMFGGYYSGKRKEGDLKAGDVIINGIHLPHFMTHHPVFEAMQIAATFRRAIDSANGNGDNKGIMESLTAKNRDAIVDLAKNKIDPKLKEAQSAEVEYNGVNYDVYLKNGEPTKIVKGGGEWTGFKTSVSGLSQQVPFFGTPGQISEGLKSDNKLNKFEGDFLRNRIEPRLLQETADWSDKDTDVKFTEHPIEYMNSDVTKRDPKTIIEYLKIGVPGFRQQVGEKAKGDDKLLKITVGTDVYELNKDQGKERQKYIEEFTKEFGEDITRSMKEAGKTDKDIALYINSKALDYSKAMIIEKYQSPDNDKINLKMKNQ